MGTQSEARRKKKRRRNPRENEDAYKQIHTNLTKQKKKFKP